MSSFTDIFLHLDEVVNTWASSLGGWFYAVLWLVIFVETGVVIFPFLPGDTLIFGLGALAAQPGATLNMWIMFFIMTSAAIVGDGVNYLVGMYCGNQMKDREKSCCCVKKKHLRYTEKFYAKHGPKAIVIARFLPIVRTFAPFVGGIGRMDGKVFVFYNVIGAIFWVALFLILGYYTGSIPFISDNLGPITFAMLIGISLFALLQCLWNARKKKNGEETDSDTSSINSELEEKPEIAEIVIESPAHDANSDFHLIDKSSGTPVSKNFVVGTQFDEQEVKSDEKVGLV